MTRLVLILTVALIVCGSASASTWQQASHMTEGTHATVCGKIVGAKYATWKSGKGTMTFLDLGRPYPNAGLTIVAWNFDATRLNGRSVCATGTIGIYKGKRELDVDSPSQIK